MRVYLVNPSHVSFGVAVITPRWLLRARGGDAARVGRSGHRATRRSSRSTPSRIAPGDVVGIGIHTGNALRGYEVGPPARASAARGSSSAASTRRSIPTRPASSAARTRWSRRRRRRLGARASHDCVAGGAGARSTRAGAIAGDRLPAGALGPAAAGHATCGRRCRPCAAARSTARSARCGGPTARSRASGRVDAVIARDRRAAPHGASASSRSPTTTSIR